MVLLPWFGKWHILTNCQNCVQPPYYPFFKVMRKRKTKSKIQICFSMSCENEKCKWHLNSIFPCHRKTVGTKVHALKFKSVFQSDEKTRNKKRKSNPPFKVRRITEYENRNSNPLFKVQRKRKTKNEIQIRFLVSQVDKKQKIEMEMEFHFTSPKKNEK